MDDNAYYKEGRKYKPFGLQYKNYLPDGIWFVRHIEGGTRITNVNKYISGIYKVGELPGYIDVPKLCSMHAYTEYVLNSKEFDEFRKRGNYTLMELVAYTVKLVVELNEKLKEKGKDGLR